MSTFVYNPGVQVFIEVTDKITNKRRLLDVTDDVTQGQLTRRANGISQFSFTLQNPARKYDYDPVRKEPRPIFTPMDRIIVNMKRLKWVRVFTGYLDSVPAFQVWPGEVQLQASCSLKRLQYWFWDSTIAASEQLVRNALLADVSSAQDGGTANVIRALLKDVVGWPEQKVHIGAIPSFWYEFIADIVKALVQDIDAANQAASLAAAASGGVASVGGVPIQVNVNGALHAGNYGGSSFDRQQCGNAEAIYTAAKAAGASDLDAAMCLGCAMQESSLVNLSGGDRDSVGLFQQRPSQGWGTVQQCMDPTYATQKFLSALQKIGNRAQMSFTQAIQTVQRSGYPDAYAQWEAPAKAMVRALVQADGTTQFANDPSLAGRAQSTGQNGLSVPKAGSADQTTFLNTAITLVTNYKIPYSLGNDSPPQTPANRITALDCSSFMQWVYCNTLGYSGNDPIPRTAGDQAVWAARNGGQRLTAQQGMSTPGAIMYATTGSDANAHHTEMSLGNGKQTVGAHHTGTYCSVEDYPVSGWSFAYTFPQINYSNVGGGGGAIVNGNTASVTPTSATPVDPNVATNDIADQKDPIDKLFNGLAWNPIDTSGASQLSNSLYGVRALMNDEALLPYLIKLAQCCLRSLCSAPNGDFMAWFPDYYGLWGTAAVMTIQDVELMNFSMNWSDLEMVTHQFVTQAITSTFNVDSGTLTNSGASQELTTTGIASIDIAPIMKALFGFSPNSAEEAKFKNFIYERFGARPDYQQLQGISGAKGEFFMALYQFMQNWAQQYHADMPTTFMPELWPGMLVQLPNYNFQAYVNSVTHSFQMGPGGGFRTNSELIAPARLSDKNALNYGLPLAGTGLPGHTYDPKNDVPTKPKGLPRNARLD